MDISMLNKVQLQIFKQICVILEGLSFNNSEARIDLDLNLNDLGFDFFEKIEAIQEIEKFYFISILVSGIEKSQMEELRIIKNLVLAVEEKLIEKGD